MRFIPLPPSYCEVWDFRTSSRESRDEVIPTQSKPLPRTPQTKGLMNGITKITKINKWLMNGMIMLDYTVQYLLSLTDNYRPTWYRLFQSSRALRWKIIRLLIQLLLTCPVSDAASERIFSSFRRVSKTMRASLSQMTLHDILRNQEEGTLMETYDPSKAVMG